MTIVAVLSAGQPVSAEQVVLEDHPDYQIITSPPEFAYSPHIKVFKIQPPLTFRPVFFYSAGGVIRINPVLIGGDCHHQCKEYEFVRYGHDQMCHGCWQ